MAPILQKNSISGDESLTTWWKALEAQKGIPPYRGEKRGKPSQCEKITEVKS